MTSTSDNDERNDDILPDDIAALLADDATWEPVDADIEDSIVAAVMAEVDLYAGNESTNSSPVVTETPGVTDTPSTAPLPDNVVAMPSRWKSAALGAAAALLVVGGLIGVMQLGGASPDIEIALAGTELAPSASAEAEITETPEGTRIVISVDALPPAAPGTYYQAWLRKDAEIGVSAGTFHLRDGDGPIELWAGVTTEDYPLLTVTLQQEAQTESSGQVVLKALIGEN